jgi:hypothetical protein
MLNRKISLLWVEIFASQIMLFRLTILSAVADPSAFNNIYNVAVGDRTLHIRYAVL